MAQKINDLTAASAVTASMQFETDLTGTTANKVTATQIAAYVKILTIAEVTAAGAYTVTGAEDIILINKTVSVANTVSIVMASLVAGKLYTIKDAKGDCDSYNITITPDTGLIDGASSFVLNNPYASIDFIKSGSNLFIVG